TFFGLLSLWAYAAYVQSKVQSPKSKVGAVPSRQGRVTKAPHARRFYALTLLFFALSLMSKPMLVTLPFLLLLLDFWPLRRLSFPAGPHASTPPLRLLLEKVPFLVLSVAASGAAYWIQGSRHNLSGLEQYPLALRVANALMSYWGYLRKLVWPADLAVFYPY